MRKATTIIFLMALIALIIPCCLVQQTSAGPPPTLRRSRFLANVNPYACSKKNQTSVCQVAGSPGATCCDGSCVDTDYSFQYCGNCNKMCKYMEACCKGKCVKISTDERNCGGCGVKCRTKCTNGYCDYAA